MNKIINLPFVSTLSAVALFAPDLAGAVDYSVQPRLEAGFMYYEFESNSISQTIPTTSTSTTAVANFTQSDFKFKDTLPFISGGATLFINQLFFDLSALKAFNGDDSATIEGSAFVLNTKESLIAFEDFTTGINADFDRTEYAVTVGYGFTRQFSVYAGYKWAETDFDLQGEGPINIANPIGTFQGTLSGKAKTEFNYDGPFIGAVYGWQINKGFWEGIVSANFAVAFLDGEVSSSSQGEAIFNRLDGETISPIRITDIEGAEGITPIFNSKGDTTGITLGLSWRGYTSVKGLTYSIGVNGYSYTFDADSPGTADIDETSIAFKAGLTYSF